MTETRELFVCIEITMLLFAEHPSAVLTFMLFVALMTDLNFHDPSPFGKSKGDGSVGNGGKRESGKGEEQQGNVMGNKNRS